MSICPDHGGYTGDSCKKCQPDAPEINRNLDMTKPLTNQGQAPVSAAKIVATGPPKIEKDDQYTLMKLENDALKSFHKMQNAQAQLQNFVNGMFSKYEVKNSEYTLDVDRMEFVARGM